MMIILEGKPTIFSHLSFSTASFRAVNDLGNLVRMSCQNKQRSEKGHIVDLSHWKFIPSWHLSRYRCEF